MQPLEQVVQKVIIVLHLELQQLCVLVDFIVLLVQQLMLYVPLVIIALQEVQHMLVKLVHQEAIVPWVLLKTSHALQVQLVHLEPFVQQVTIALLQDLIQQHHVFKVIIVLQEALFIMLVPRVQFVQLQLHVLLDIIVLIQELLHNYAQQDIIVLREVQHT